MHSRPSKNLPLAALVLFSLLMLLSGCSTQPLPETLPEKTDARPLPAPEKTSPKIGSQPPSPATEEPKPPVNPCVYKSTKGVAEITDISPTLITFKFYPGDQYFKLPVDHMPIGDVELGQELKAIIRSPLSGPCGEIEFELMSTID